MAKSNYAPQADAGSSPTSVDGARLMRVLTDAQYVEMADSFLSARPEGADRDGADVAQVVDLQSKAQDRLAGDREFVLDVARHLGENRLAAEAARATAAQPEAGASFQQKLTAEGGVLAFVERRLDGASPEARTFEADSTACCVGGVLLIVAGAGITIFGPKFLGPVAEVVGPAAVVVGVVYAASCC